MASSRRTVFAQLQRLIWERIPARTDGPAPVTFTLETEEGVVIDAENGNVGAGSLETENA